MSKRKSPKPAQRARSLKSRRAAAADFAKRPIVSINIAPELRPAPKIAAVPSGLPRLIDGDSAHRKNFPMFEGLLAYFPDALAYVAYVSKVGNDKHNPGQPMHHARSKSGDHADCIVRHLASHGGWDDANMRESGSLAWRALALLQEELERDLNLPLPRGAKA